MFKEINLKNELEDELEVLINYRGKFTNVFDEIDRAVATGEYKFDDYRFNADTEKRIYKKVLEKLDNDIEVRIAQLADMKYKDIFDFIQRNKSMYKN